MIHLVIRIPSRDGVDGMRWSTLTQTWSLPGGVMALVLSTRSEWSKGIKVLGTSPKSTFIKLYSQFVGNRTSGPREIL